MSNLTLYAESGWVSPWVLHVMVALEEKRLPYALELVPLPIPPEQRDDLRRRAVLGQVPLLVHGDVAIGDSLAISEYLAETFPFPAHPRLFPADLVERARARQILLFVRTALFALREERPTSSLFGAPVSTPLSPKARADADELVRLAEQLLVPGRPSLFADWCIADADLGLALSRLVRNRDAVPAHVAAYADAQWQRPSMQMFIRRAQGV
jgi:glutathione S-transferase